MGAYGGKKDAWGPDNLDGWWKVFANPYAASFDFMPPEFRWSDEKNYVGNSSQAIPNKTPAQTIAQMRERTHRDRTYKAHAKWAKKSIAAMNSWIEKDQKYNNSPLTGDMSNLSGFPADLSEWKRLAGMKESGPGFEDAEADTLLAGLEATTMEVS